MKRQVTMEEISDGKLYTSNDLVKADCGDCEGCHACCTGMGSSIVLDPLDIVRICRGTGAAFETLLAGKIELNVVDGIILPNLKMAGAEDGCGFLTEEGRCGIHPFRPGICRLFPLGRYYEENGFRYFLQVHECQKENRAKVKVKKWLDTPDLKKYETYIARWHGLQHTRRAQKRSAWMYCRDFTLLRIRRKNFTVNFSREWTKQKRHIVKYN